MVRRLTCCVMALALVVGPLASLALADDKDPLKAYEMAGKPGPEHKALQPLVGEWTYVAKFWLKPDAKPLEGSGSSVRKSIFGGRFIQEKLQSEKPTRVTGMGLIGYDKGQKKYTSLWVDSMSTAIYIMHGTADKDGKKFTFLGTHVDPVTRKEVKGRLVLRIVGKDKVVVEESWDQSGKWVKVVEGTYTRKMK
jgi:hypothetical protein